MRFGKKLALQVTDDQSGAPYLSHKLMKEAINKTVRELRLYQSKQQFGSEQVWRGPGDHQEAEAAPQAELEELAERVSALDAALFSLVDEDLERILQHIRGSEVLIKQRIVALQQSAIDLGMLVEESQMQQLERSLPVAAENRTVLCQQLLELWLRSEPVEASKQLEDLGAQYNDLVECVNRLTQYLEINVAGFRKLLKRHEKQIPLNFHARHTPFLGFHKLVTHASRQILEVTKQFGVMLTDAWDRLSRIAPECRGLRPELKELKNLGAECQMVLEIQKQLKDPLHGNILQLQSQSASPGFLYPKPGAELTPNALNAPNATPNAVVPKAKSGAGSSPQPGAVGISWGQQQQPQLTATATDQTAAMQAWWALQQGAAKQATGPSLAAGLSPALLGASGGFGLQPGANAAEELWRILGPNMAAAASATAASATAASNSQVSTAGSSATESLSEVERLRAELAAERSISAATRIELQRLQGSAVSMSAAMPLEVQAMTQVLAGAASPGLWHNSI